MAKRKIPAPPGSRNRDQIEDFSRRIVAWDHGGTRTVGGKCTGGESMFRLLGPDALPGQMGGSVTDDSSLQSVMGPLRMYSPDKNWVAGHLLNADLGGSGIDPRNLTPLTTAANRAHSVFEQHIKRMLECCNRLDQNNPDADVWYGVDYTVTVSPTTYGTAGDTGDWYSYVYSHLTLEYGFVRLPKFPCPQDVGQPVQTSDHHVDDLQRVPRPQFNGQSRNIENWRDLARVNGGLTGMAFSVEIHNEP